MPAAHRIGLPGRRGARGFNLIELMVTVLIIGILGGIALPTYTASIRKSRRTEARTALLDIAGREERYFSMNNSTYTESPASLGYGTFTPVGSGYYNVTVRVTGVPLVAGIPPTFLITATPVPTQSQQQDVECPTFTLDNTGLQGPPGSASCWR